MTSKRKDGSIKGTRLTGLVPADSTYDVGYGKPPTTSKFKKGSSGNPNGRPKGSKNRSPFDEERFASIFMDEANRKIKINEGGRKISIPIIQAAMRALMVNAAKGEIRSLRFVIDRFMAEEAKQKQRRADFFEAAVEYKIQCREIMAGRGRQVQSRS